MDGAARARLGVRAAPDSFGGGVIAGAAAPLTRSLLALCRSRLLGEEEAAAARLAAAPSAGTPRTPAAQNSAQRCAGPTPRTSPAQTCRTAAAPHTTNSSRGGLSRASHWPARAARRPPAGRGSRALRSQPRRGGMAGSPRALPPLLLCVCLACSLLAPGQARRERSAAPGRSSGGPGGGGGGSRATAGEAGLSAAAAADMVSEHMLRLYDRYSAPQALHLRQGNTVRSFRALPAGEPGGAGTIYGSGPGRRDGRVCAGQAVDGAAALVLEARGEGRRCAGPGLGACAPGFACLTPADEPRFALRPRHRAFTHCAQPASRRRRIAVPAA